jgi:hypothetical protein
MAQDDRTKGLDLGTQGSSGTLAHSHDLKHFKLPEGDPDPRGWDVKTADGQKLGKVDDLLVDSATGRVRYLEVEVDKDVVKQGAREYYLVPVGTARLDDDRDDVVVNLGVSDLADVPVYQRGAVSRDYEQSLQTHLRGRSRTVGAAGTTVPLGTTADRDVDFYASPEYDDRSFFGSRRTGARGVAGRVADKVDDLKDRVDANPDSRPGPDATDRPGYGTAGTTGTVGATGAGLADRTEGAVERGARRVGNAVDDLKDRVDANPASRPGPDSTDRPGRL